MRTRKIPHIFAFDESERSNVILGPNTRLHPKEHNLQLFGAGSQGESGYPTDSDLFAKTRLLNPGSMKQWLGFDVDIVNVYDPDLEVEVTGANYRLNDGANDLYWDGGAWTVAGASDWNTEADIAEHIDTFPATSQSIQVIINMWTTDSEYTPRVREVRLLFSSTIEELEDLVWRSLVRKMRSDVRPITDHPIKFAAGGTTIDLANDYPLKTPYNIVGVDSVFNYDTDQAGQVDLLDSFDVNTKIITLNTSLSADTRVWIKLIYEPEVAVTTSQEYSELSKVPAIVIMDVNAVDSAKVGQDTCVRNKSAGTGVAVKGPKQADIDMLIECVADKQKDLQRLVRELEQFFVKNPLLKSTGLDRYFRLWLVDEYDGRTEATQSELHVGRLRARIVDALFFDQPAADVYTLDRFNLTGSMNVVIT